MVSLITQSFNFQFSSALHNQKLCLSKVYTFSVHLFFKVLEWTCLVSLEKKKL